MKDRIFYSTCFGFLLGTLIQSLTKIDFYLVCFILLISFCIFFFYILLSKNKWGIILSIFLISICLGILRFDISNKQPSEIFESKVGEKVEVSGIIAAAPDYTEKSQKLTVSVKEDNAETKILVSTDFDNEFRYGDEITIKGKLEKPENFETDQGKIFYYINYLKKDGIEYLIGFAEIEIISEGNGNFLKSILFSAKEKFLEKINQVVENPENLLLGGLILGEKSAFSEELRQAFVNTGTIHIVALSGYNITIVAEWFMKVFAFLPINFGLLSGIFAVFFFVLMTGASSTGLRAGIMAALVLISRLNGRTYHVGRALVLAGVLMVLFNPYVLVYDVSFQLSFLATVGLIFFAPRFENYFTWVPKNFGLKEVVSVTSAVYIFVLPFILYKMGNLSVVAIPANILILPLIPLTMLLGFLTAFTGMIWFGFSVPFGYLSYLLLHYELGVVNFFAGLSFASFTVPDFPGILVCIIYAYFIYLMFWEKIKELFSESF